MDRLTNTPFFRLAAAGDTEHIEAEYRNFMDSVYTLCRENPCLMQTYFTLTHTLIELNDLHGHSCHVPKAISLLEAAIKWIEEHCEGLQVENPPPTGFVWTGKAVQLIEIAYAFAEVKCINNGDVGIAEFVAYLSAVFGVELENCFGVYGDIKRRKGDSRTYFLDMLRERLNQRMERDDEKEYERRR